MKADNREVKRNSLTEADISTAFHWPVSIHKQPAFDSKSKLSVTLPITEEFADKILSLPMNAHMKLDQVDGVSDKLREISLYKANFVFEERFAS